MNVRITQPSGRVRALGVAMLPILGLALPTGMRAAEAQTFTGSIIARPFSMPGGPGLPPAAAASREVPVRAAEAPSTAADPVPPAEASTHGPAAKSDRLLRPPVSPVGWRMGGETGELAWPFYLTPDASRRTTRFRLTYRTDISALPEASKVVLSVNGTRIGAVDGQAARPRVALFDLPAGLLQPGFNAVTVRSEQHHRVDCSLPATYELWAEIDPAETGFVLASGGADPIPSLADLPALPVRQDGALAIRIVVDAKLQPRDLARAVRAAAALALASRTLQPIVDFGPPSADASVNIVVGRNAAVDALRAKLDPLHVLAAGLAMSPATPDRAATLVVSGLADADVDAAVSALATRPATAGSAAGRRLAELPHGPSTVGRETIPFGAFGVGPTIFEGRRFTTQLPIVLPADFLPADYGQVALNLVGAYGPDLGAGAEILVRVNDRDAASWPMAKAAGAEFNGQSLGLPLSLFRPGPNRIEITALLPGRKEEGACSDAMDGRSRGRFVLSDQSSLRVPALARIGRSPELATAAAGGVSTSLPRGLRLIVPQPDRESLAAAATLASKLTTVQGRVPAIAFSRDAKTARTGDTLFVAPAQSLDRASLATIGADGAAMQRAWRARAEQVAHARSEPLTTGSAGDPSRSGSSACSPEALRSGRTSAVRRIVPAQQEIVSDLSPETARAAGGGGWLTGLLGRGDRLGRLARWPIERASDLLRATTSDPFAPEADDISILAQGGSGDDQFFVMTAPSSLDLKLAAECLVDPRSWRDVAGRAVLMRSADGAMRSVATEHHTYTSTQPWALSNVRLIAAGILSLNPALFVALALVLATILTFSTRSLVRNVGRRQP